MSTRIYADDYPCPRSPRVTSRDTVTSIVELSLVKVRPAGERVAKSTSVSAIGRAS
jgi:hypothetical protein